MNIIPQQLRRLLPIVTSALAALALTLASAHAQGPEAATAPETTQPPALDGEWRIAISDDEARRRIDRGIDAATEGMAPIVNGIAARALRERTPIIRRIRIATTPSRILVHLDDRTYDSAPGMPENEQSRSGDQIRMVQHFRGAALEQVFENPRGTRWNTFRVDQGGQAITMEAVVQSSSLPAALRFTLPYRRVER